MFGIGMTELLVIMAVALVVFGPKRLPELARSMGKALGEFRQASTDLRQTLSETPPPVAGPTEPPAAPSAEAANPPVAATTSPAPTPAPPATRSEEDDSVHRAESDEDADSVHRAEADEEADSIHRAEADEDAVPASQGAGEPARKDPPA